MKSLATLITVAFISTGVYAAETKKVCHDKEVKGKTVQVAVEMENEKSRPLRDVEREFLQKYIEN